VTATQPPSDEELERSCRRLAAQANNRAWALAEQESRTPVEEQELLHAAHAARYLWGKIGTAKNVALAELLLGHVHALMGLSASALRYAEAAQAYFASNPGEPWEVAFSEAALAFAAEAAGRADVHRAHYARALELREELSGPDRDIFDASFRFVPEPTSKR
jgi:hypothetical protein